MIDASQVLVVGAGKSGRAAARLLKRKGARVTIIDTRPPPADAQQASSSEDTSVHWNASDPRVVAGHDLVVVSPGVAQNAILQRAEVQGVRVWSEVELAFRFLNGRMVAITGTNGKSTVTALIGQMLRATKQPVFVGGNLGTPLCEAVDTDAGEVGFTVAEVSSFQLERVRGFRPNVAVLLNISPDHIDRHGSFGAYAGCKGRIFHRQRRGDAAVVPEGAALCTALATVGAAQVRAFSRFPVHNGVLRCAGVELPISEVGLQGAHNYMNISAAATAASLCGAGAPAMIEGIRSFDSLPHRMQLVCEAKGIRFYDDSKATNVAAAVAAIQGLRLSEGKVVLIAGGRDKGGSFETLEEAMRLHGRAMVLIGEAADRMERSMKHAVVLRRGSGMAEAVDQAWEIARPGDAILLAPGCSSFDMFDSFEERGRVFQRLAWEKCGRFRCTN